MATSLTSTGITFPDATTQTTAATAAPAPGYQVFTTSGTFSVPSGVTKVKVIVIGAGGNGGTANNTYGNGGGGGAGGCVIDIVSVTSGGSCTVTVGTNAGTRTSSFVGVTTITASGGTNGNNSTSSQNNGTAGPSGAYTMYGVTKNDLGPSYTTYGTTTRYAGATYVSTVAGVTTEPYGGVWGHGFGVTGTYSSNLTLRNASGYGAGGVGGLVGTTTGGTGTNGLVIVEW